MNLSSVVSNASPIIALAQIGYLDFLAQIFQTVIIPPAVATEISPSVIRPPWIELQNLSQPIGPQILRASLGPGESETISLALEMNAGLVILDERAGRRLAHSLGLPVIGTLGVLLNAKRRGLLTSIKPCLDQLLEFDFHISPALYDRILQDANETD